MSSNDPYKHPPWNFLNNTDDDGTWNGNYSNNLQDLSNPTPADEIRAPFYTSQSLYLNNGQPTMNLPEYVASYGYPAQYAYQQGNLPLPFHNVGAQTPQPSTSASEPSETVGKLLLQCPISQMNLQSGNPLDCTGVGGESMAAVRRHLRRSHGKFVMLCPTCNEDIIDQQEFHGYHGIQGELCQTPQQQRRGKAAETQWSSLLQKLYPQATQIPSPYGLVTTTRPENTQPSLQWFSDRSHQYTMAESGPQLSAPAPPTSHIPTSIVPNYTTPYELIFSDDEHNDVEQPGGAVDDVSTPGNH